MRKAFKIIAITVPLALSLGVVAMYIQYVGSTEAIVELHPEIDPQICRRVSAEMFREALMGEYSDLNLSDDDYEALFLTKVMQHTND